MFGLKLLLPLLQGVALPLLLLFSPVAPDAHCSVAVVAPPVHASGLGHLCICVDPRAECQYPASGTITSPPGHSALAGQGLQDVSVGSRLKLPAGHTCSGHTPQGHLRSC
eukprot:GHUV01038323.1.p5 GENE.GHUV01038323.1~~GHUV01038323.1.p5  ORF type:complete len:110 (-),score=24.29 GHUV01038323.1:1098-1427(-)